MKVVSGRWSVVGKSVFGFALCAMLFALCQSLSAQPPTRLHKIGFLSAVSLSSIPSNRVEAFRQGLRELGYVEGKNIVVEYRYADGKPDRLKEIVAELLRLKVEVIVTGGPTATRTAKEATSTIPIVMGFDNDPVGAGFVDSLARPGKNVTGLSTLHPEISGKQLELLKEMIPMLSRIAILGNWSQPGNVQALKELKAAAEALGLHAEYLEIKASTDRDAVFREAVKGRVEAVFVLANPAIIYQRAHFISHATKNRLPSVYSQPEL